MSVGYSRRPLCRQKQKITACVIKEVINVVMRNHYYSYNNTTYRQTKGAGIGNSASEKLGKLLMKRFDRKFKAMLVKLKIEVDLYRRYVDDITASLISLDPGVRFEGGKMVFKRGLVEEDRKVNSDKRTFSELVKIADSIYECIKFTAEVPSSQEGEKVPVLDLKLHVGEEGSIVYEFYEKPVSCRLVIPCKSAHSKRMKLAVMVEEGVRRLRNHSRGVEWEGVRLCMEKWSRKLRRSGYPATFRHQVIKAAVDKWKKMCVAEDEGVRPVHRPREWKRKDRKLAKVVKKTSWHQKKGEVSAPLILDPVEGDMVELMKTECQKFESLYGVRVAVIQRAGKSVKPDAKSEQLRKLGCERKGCFPCCKPSNQDKKVNCERNSIGYRIVCEPAD